MGKCESCGTEDIETQRIEVGGHYREVCPRCYAEIQKNKMEMESIEFQKVQFVVDTNSLWDAVNKSYQHLNESWKAIGKLQEHLPKLWDQVNKLWDTMSKQDYKICEEVADYIRTNQSDKEEMAKSIAELSNRLTEVIKTNTEVIKKFNKNIETLDRISDAHSSIVDSLQKNHEMLWDFVFETVNKQIDALWTEVFESQSSEESSEEKKD